MPYARDIVRVYANETRGSTWSAKSRCRDCEQPITWFYTLNGHKLPLNGHEPVPLKTERELASNRTVEIHERASVHFETCPERNRP